MVCFSSDTGGMCKDCKQFVQGLMVCAPYSRLSLAIQTGTTLCASTSTTGMDTAPHTCVDTIVALEGV
jgi:hypothetical protein